jgi:Domain of unknown function (DUF4917)
MTDHPADLLYHWQEIADMGWETLLVGNGLSINVSEKFAYDSLYEEAEKGSAGGQLDDETEESSRRGGLDDLDLAVFERFETNNFEVVLGKLSDAISIAGILEEPTVAYRQRFRSVQTALGEAVRSVHLPRSKVPDASLEAIKRQLGSYKAIFSTCYDLIVYWAIGYEERYGDFRDCFWGPNGSFELDNCGIHPGNKPIYYMHGALHLIVDGSGTTRKLVADDRTLLDQFGEPIPGDPEARALLISEGDARDKLRAIEANDYLLHVYEDFGSRDGPLLVFGHALGKQDRHLIEAINANPERPVAVSIAGKDEQAKRECLSAIWARLETKDKYFFDATTHPLGAAELKAKDPPIPFRRLPLKPPAASPRTRA